MWRFFGKREVFVDIFKLLMAASITAAAGLSVFPSTAVACVDGVGCEPEDPVDPPPVKKKGNNGWGNGDEGTNNGSDDGGTEDTKIDESRDAGDTSPGPDKFTTR
jgi:hypothetical protein